MRKSGYRGLVGLAFVLFAVFFNCWANAQTLPAYNGRMNTAIGGLVSAKVGKWGFAANDPRFTATASGIGTGLTTLGVGIATGAVATVGWPALLAAAGISAVVGGGVSLAIDSLYKWLFNTDGTVTTQGGGTITVPNPNGQWYPANPAGCTMVNNVMDLCVRVGQQSHYFSACFPPGGSNPTLPCSSNQTMTFTQAMAQSNYVMPTSTSGADVTKATPGTAAAAIPTSELSKPMSNEMLAAAANAAWKAAAANSGGIPWSASDPITPADVAQWRAANPSSVPTVSDMTAPITNGSAVSVGADASGSSPSTGPAATPGSGTQVDLGPNPNTPAPGLEATPTAQQILSPVLGLMPDLRSFQVPAHTGACPTPSFVAFNRTYTFDSHCGLIENSRSIIEAAMMLVWGIAAVFIVLRA